MWRWKGKMTSAHYISYFHDPQGFTFNKPYCDCPVRMLRCGSLSPSKHHQYGLYLLCYTLLWCDIESTTENILLPHIRNAWPTVMWHKNLNIEPEPSHFHMNNTNTIEPSPRFFFLFSPSLRILFDSIVQFIKPEGKKFSHFINEKKKKWRKVLHFYSLKDSINRT